MKEDEYMKRLKPSDPLLSPEASKNAQAISHRANGKLAWMEQVVVPRILDSKDSRSNKYFRLVEVQEKAYDLVKPNTPCKKGCYNCCYMAVPINEFEADRIAEYTGRQKAKLDYEVSNKSKEAVEAAHERMIHNADVKFMRTPCTFLGIEGDCTIYPVRPMPCRTHHVIEADAEHCDLFTQLSGANQTDLGWLTAATTGLFLHTIIADIREWFPDYKGG